MRVAAGKSRSVRAPGGPITPTADLARGRTTFPTSPLPAGMSPPSSAVDGNSATSWRPGPTGRMVVDLGDVFTVTTARLAWTAGRVRPLRIERSTDGLTYTTVARTSRPRALTEQPIQAAARYVAVVVDSWRPGDAELADFAVFG